MDPWQYDEQELEANLSNEMNTISEVCGVWCFGKNKDGELGLKHTRNSRLPEQVKSLKDKVIVHASSGGGHSALVDSDGKLYVSGSALHGKLGLEKINKVSISTFTLFPQSNKKAVLQVECGDYHTICLFEDGRVCSWGGTLHKVR